MIDDLKVPPIQITDPLAISRVMEKVSPGEVFGEFGFDQRAVNKMMSGDLSPIHEKFRDQVSILDFEKVMDVHLKVLSKPLCSLFFDRAKGGQSFTEEEIELYGDTYRRMFTGFFEAGRRHVFVYEKAPDSRNLLVKKDGETYQLSLIGEEAYVMFIGDV